MKKEMVKLSKDALHFTDTETFAKLASSEEGKPRALKMTAYSGKVIKGHWYWGDLAIDTAGLKLSKKEIPILSDHDTNKKIGFGVYQVNENHEVVCSQMSFVDTDDSKNFIKLSDEGFPFEASIYARPSKIQRLMEDEVTDVNGYQMKGPGTVWRESVLKECSIVTFGADSNTKSAAMSENEDVVLEVDETEKPKFEEEVNMDLAKLKADHPDLFAEVFALGKVEAEEAFASERAGLDAQIKTLTADKEKLTADNKDVSTRVLKLEKEEVIRKEHGIKMSADAVFNEKIKGASIPERLIPKIRKQINHEAFVKDDKLDVEAFGAAVDAELKDWAPVEGEDTTILGMSFSRPSDEGSADDVVKRMLGHVGQV